MEEKTEQRRRRGTRRFVTAILVILLLAAMSVSGLLFMKYRNVVQNDPAKEGKRIAARIEEFVQLPDEEPAVSTVADKTKLTNQTLQERTENGDKLLIYANSKRLIIYRPSSGKVVDMLSIQAKQPLETSQTQTNATPSATP